MKRLLFLSFIFVASAHLNAMDDNATKCTIKGFEVASAHLNAMDGRCTIKGFEHVNLGGQYPKSVVEELENFNPLHALAKVDPQFSLRLAIQEQDVSAVRDAYKEGAQFDDAAFQELRQNPDLDVAREIAYLDPKMLPAVKKAMGAAGELV